MGESQFFGLQAGSGRAKFASGELAGGYLCTCRYLIWVSSLQLFLDFGQARVGQNLLRTGGLARLDT